MERQIESFKLRNHQAAANKKRSKKIAHKNDRRSKDARRSFKNEEY